MRTTFRLLTILFAGLFVTSCASVHFRPLSSGETRLTHMEMPDIIREDLQYEVILSVASEEKLDIRKICFRWVTEEAASGSPVFYSSSPKGADFSREPLSTGWRSPQSVFIGSEQFCAAPEDIRMNVPGKIIVKIRPAHLSGKYNRLEGQAEYLSEGRTRMTNKIGTRVIIDQ